MAPSGAMLSPIRAEMDDDFLTFDDEPRLPDGLLADAVVGHALEGARVVAGHFADGEESNARLGPLIGASFHVETFATPFDSGGRQRVARGSAFQEGVAAFANHHLTSGVDNGSRICRQKVKLA